MVTLVIICGVLYNQYLNQVNSNLSYAAAAEQNNGSNSATAAEGSEDETNHLESDDNTASPEGSDPATVPVTADTPASEPETAAKGTVTSPSKPSSSPSNSTPSGGTAASTVGAAGSKAVVSVATPQSNAAQPADSSTAEQATTGSKEAANQTETASTSASVDKPTATVKLPTTYVVQKGDTLSIISEKFYQTKEYFSLIAEHNNILFINDMKVGDTLKIPALPAANSGKSNTSAAKPDYSKVTLPATYLIQAGDTLSSISLQFYKSKKYVDLLAKENGLDANSGLKAGSHLTIPALDSTGSSSSLGSAQTAAGEASGTGTAAASSDNDNSDGYETTDHTVTKGETLYSISRAYYGSNEYASFLADYNHVVDMDNVKIGTVLKIPKLK